MAVIPKHTDARLVNIAYLAKSFAPKFVINEQTGCWEWIAGIDHLGYGTYWHKFGKYNGYRAHRFSYELIFGYTELPLDHLCRNRKCVNPRHLEAVTNRVNTMRSNAISAVNARKQFCKRGHEFTPENTEFKPNRRTCKICKNYLNARRLLRLKELEFSKEDSDASKIKRIRTNNTSGFTGVKATQSGKWEAIINIQHQKISLGTFVDKLEAAHTYATVSEQLYGTLATKKKELEKSL